MAVVRFLSGKQDEYGVDPNDIYASGHSGGSLGVYGLAYSTQANYPTLSTSKLCTGLVGALSPVMGDLNNITLDAYKTSTYNLDAISIWGGSTWINNPKYTNIFDPTDNIPAIIFHGMNDGSIPITGSSDHQSQSNIKSQFVSNSIPFWGFAMCNGSHEVISYNGVQNASSPKPSTATNLLSQDVSDILGSNTFLDIAKVGKPYIATSTSYFNQATNNLKAAKYAFLAKQIYDMGFFTSFFYQLSTFCEDPTDDSQNQRDCIYGTIPFPGQGASFQYAKTIDFPFDYPTQKFNGHFIGGGCTAIPNLRTANPNSNVIENIMKSDKIKEIIVKNSKKYSANKVHSNSINIYPSPATNIVNINFGVKSAGTVTMSVYDMLGKNISTIINNENMEQGEYNKQFDASNLPSGVYKLIMNSSDGETITKSIIVQK